MRQLAAFHTPHPTRPIWGEDPPAPPPGTEPDERAPRRTRYVRGVYKVLVEHFHYKVFPPPEVRAAMKAAGKVVIPIWIEQCYVHLLNTRFNESWTLKIYRHQSDLVDVAGKWVKVPRYFFADSRDFLVTAAKAPPKTRVIMVATIAAKFKLTEEAASALLMEWTGY